MECQKDLNKKKQVKLNQIKSSFNKQHTTICVQLCCRRTAGTPYRTAGTPYRTAGTPYRTATFVQAFRCWNVRIRI